jgi:subtilisin-like proprotein convertase family protein
MDSDSWASDLRECLRVRAALMLAAVSLAAAPAAAAMIHQVPVDNPGPIADDGTTVYTFTVSATGAVQEAKLQLAMDHEFPEDLTLTLRDPSGVEVVPFEEMFVRNIGQVSTAEFQDALFSFADPATRRIGSVNNDTSPFTGTYQIQDPTVGDGDLDEYVGVSAPGTWTLTVDDAEAEDTGSLYGEGEQAPWGPVEGTKLILTLPQSGEQLIPEPITMCALGVGLGCVTGYITYRTKGRVGRLRKF